MAAALIWLIVCSDESHLPKQWWQDKAAALTVTAEVAKIFYYLAGGIFRGPKSIDSFDTAKINADRLPDSASRNF
jgi:hypothetical protein